MSEISILVDRRVGVVKRIGQGGFGFISLNETGEEDVYFRVDWFSGTPALEVGEAVTFQVRLVDGKPQARDLRRVEERATASESAQAVVLTLDALTPSTLDLL